MSEAGRVTNLDGDTVHAYEPFGNFAYCYVGQRAGFTPNELINGAHTAQLASSGHLDPGSDQTHIMSGIAAGREKSQGNETMENLGNC